MAERTRTFWKGYLRLALVTIPVRMMTATRSDSTFHFHQIDRKSKQRIRYQKVVPGKGVIPAEDIVSGYEVEPGNYVLFDGEDLDTLKLETRHTIELVQFVEHCEIDPLYFDKPYYLLPDGDMAEEGYRVLRDALRDERKVGIGQLTLRGKEYLVALQSSGAGLLLETLRYEKEVKEADDVFTDIGTGKVREDMVAMAKLLIKQHSKKFDPSKFRNHYTEALRKIVDSHLKKGKIVTIDEDEDAPKLGQVVDFMEALKRSLKGDKAKTTRDALSQDNEPPKESSRRKGAEKKSGSGAKRKAATNKTAAPKTAAPKTAAPKRRKAS